MAEHRSPGTISFELDNSVFTVENQWPHFNPCIFASVHEG